jgi:ubiquinone/menaquinone biosynthesis C-methylase UbiE
MKKKEHFFKLYLNRKLVQGYPDLNKLALDWFKPHLESKGSDASRIERLLTYLNRLSDLPEGKKLLVLGCGPRPETVKILLSRNYNVLCIEPVASFVLAARDFVGRPGIIIEGSAEEIPLPSNSQDFVFCESILEHVDSPIQSLREIYRILAPGGGVYISTTNRYRISFKGQNGEFNVRFFNWLPDVVKESFVFQHLHYEPSLANYTERPAVHWYSYADLCKLGRQAGFSKFYSLIDLLDTEDQSVKKSRTRKFLLNRLKYSPWFRSLALIQLGGTIIMLKRSE